MDQKARIVSLSQGHTFLKWFLVFPQVLRKFKATVKSMNISKSRHEHGRKEKMVGVGGDAFPMPLHKSKGDADRSSLIKVWTLKVGYCRILRKTWAKPYTRIISGSRARGSPSGWFPCPVLSLETFKHISLAEKGLRLLPALYELLSFV